MIRLMTYNIHYWEGMDSEVDIARVTQVIEREAPDIVGLNEVFHPYTAEGEDQPVLHQIAEQLGMDFVFAAATHYRFGLREDGVLTPYGNALLSRWPIHHVATTTLDADDHAPRSLIAADIETPSGPLRVLVTHLDYLSEAIRMKQMREVLRYAEGEHVLMGDFNTLVREEYADFEEVRRRAAEIDGTPIVASEVVPDLLARGYTDAFATAGEGPALTWSAAEPLMRIDYILLTPGLAGRLRTCRRVDEFMASDHMPVIAELD